MIEIVGVLKTGDAVVNAIRHGHIKTAQQVPMVMVPLSSLPIAGIEDFRLPEPAKSKSTQSWLAPLAKWAAILGALYLGAMALKRTIGLPSARINWPSTADPGEYLRTLNPENPSYTLDQLLEIMSLGPPDLPGVSLHIDPSKFVR